MKKKIKEGRNLGRQAVREEGGRNAHKIIQNQAKSKFKLFQISVLMDSLQINEKMLKKGKGHLEHYV